MFGPNGQYTKQCNNESDPRFVGKLDLKTTSIRQAIPQSSSTATRFPLSSERIISPPTLPDMGLRYHLPPDLFHSYSHGISRAVPGSYKLPEQHLSISGSTISPRHQLIRNSCSFVTPEVTVTKFQRSNQNSNFIGRPSGNANDAASNFVDHPVKRECRGMKSKVLDEEFVELPSTPPMVPKHLSDSVVIVPLNLSQLRTVNRQLPKKGSKQTSSNSFQVIEPSPSRIPNDRRGQQLSPSSSLSDSSTSDEEHDVASVLCSFKGKSIPTKFKKLDSIDSDDIGSVKYQSKKRKYVSDESHKMRPSKHNKSLP